ncbi:MULTISPECIES: hypothetical protein [unclassified Pseudonocardia]|uniref:hypothetical protein n=1 Tax=unclassified Pseudonocardia TaxID=2619320 RepID=UPI000A8E8A42|nr:MULTISPECIES: hypothetical protein [unclassified Pseudonocardia]
MTATMNGAAGESRSGVGQLAPKGPEAKAHGCVCSVLANAAYRAGVDDHACIDPLCGLHVAAGAATET